MKRRLGPLLVAVVFVTLSAGMATAEAPLTETLTETYVSAYEAYLEARLKNDPSVPDKRQAFDQAYQVLIRYLDTGIAPSPEELASAVAAIPPVGQVVEPLKVVPHVPEPSVPDVVATPVDPPASPAVDPVAIPLPVVCPPSEVFFPPLTASGADDPILPPIDPDVPPPLEIIASEPGPTDLPVAPDMDQAPAPVLDPDVEIDAAIASYP